MKVLFCGRDMHFGFQFTKEELEDTDDVVVVQCDRENTKKELQDTDVVVPLMTALPGSLLKQAPTLKLVIQYGTGVEAVDTLTATELGIWVSNIPSGNTPNAASCAEMAILLTLATLRNINAMQGSIQNRRLGVPLGCMLQSLDILVVGFGSIAKELIPRLVPFGVTISALRRSPWGSDADIASQRAESALKNKGVWPEDGARLTATADVIIITCKQDASNVGLVDAGFLRSCKQGVRIVNVARGGLLDYAAVLAGLNSGKIGGMGLDVQFFEPFDPEDPIAAHPSVYLTPHVAGVTQQSYRAMAKVVAAEVRRLRAGQPPTIQLNAPPHPRAP